MTESFDDKLALLYGVSPQNTSSHCELSVAVVLAPSFTATPIAGFLDVLRLAADEADYSRQFSCQWTILGDYEGQIISSSSGLAIIAWQAYADVEVTDFDYVIVVGGRLPLSFELSHDGYNFIREAHQEQTTVIALCVGSFIVARLGLLDGKKCAVGFGHEREMNVLFPDVHTYSNRLYMEDNHIISCGGGVSAIDLANDIVSKHCGKARSIKTMRSMLLDTHRTPPEMPIFNYDNAKEFGDWQLQQVITYMENNLNHPVSLRVLSDTIGTSINSINKSFKVFLRMTPAQFWLELRLQHARHLLLNTDKQMATIAEETGFHDAAHFSKRYKIAYGSTPLKTRKTHLRQLRVRHTNKVS